MYYGWGNIDSKRLKNKKLEKYAKFVAAVRAYLEEGIQVEEAVSMAMDECIQKGILEDVLRNHREEIRSMILTEYDEQAHIKNEREIALEEGKAVGEAKLSKLIQLLLESERIEDIVRVTSEEEY